MIGSIGASLPAMSDNAISLKDRINFIAGKRAPTWRLKSLCTAASQYFTC